MKSDELFAILGMLAIVAVWMYFVVYKMCKALWLVLRARHHGAFKPENNMRSRSAGGSVSDLRMAEHFVGDALDPPNFL